MCSNIGSTPRSHAQGSLQPKKHAALKKNTGVTLNEATIAKQVNDGRPQSSHFFGNFLSNMSEVMTATSAQEITRKEMRSTVNPRQNYMLNSPMAGQRSPKTQMNAESKMLEVKAPPLPPCSNMSRSMKPNGHLVILLRMCWIPTVRKMSEATWKNNHSLSMSPTNIRLSAGESGSHTALTSEPQGVPCAYFDGPGGQAKMEKECWWAFDKTCVTL